MSADKLALLKIYRQRIELNKKAIRDLKVLIKDIELRIKKEVEGVK